MSHEEFFDKYSDADAIGPMSAEERKRILEAYRHMMIYGHTALIHSDNGNFGCDCPLCGEGEDDDDGT